MTLYLGRFTCPRCGETFAAEARGPRIRHCVECKPLRRQETYRAYLDRWPVERRRAHWRKAKQRQRAQLGSGGEYLRRKRNALRRAMGRAS